MDRMHTAAARVNVGARRAPPPKPARDGRRTDPRVCPRCGAPDRFEDDEGVWCCLDCVAFALTDLVPEGQ